MHYWDGERLMFEHHEHNGGTRLGCCDNAVADKRLQASQPATGNPRSGSGVGFFQTPLS